MLWPENMKAIKKAKRSIDLPKVDVLIPVRSTIPKRDLELMVGGQAALMNRMKEYKESLKPNPIQKGLELWPEIMGLIEKAKKKL